MSPAERALLEGDWQAVIDTLERDDSTSSDAVARLLMGHATLATNQNNASMRLFLSVDDDNSLRNWFDWTVLLLRSNPHNPMALYLMADAQARIGRSDDAISTFTHALELKPDFALALNARGVVYVLKSEFDRALVDFYMATKFAPGLADAHSNLGTLAVLQESSLHQGDAALVAFNKALEINPDFAIAYNGRGCLSFGSGEFSTALEDFARASELTPYLTVAELNTGFAAAYASQLREMADMANRPGATFHTSLEVQQQEIQHRRQELEQSVVDDVSTLR